MHTLGFLTRKAQDMCDGSSGSCIKVRSLGIFELSIHGSPIRRWQAGKARHLLQLLLLHKGRPLSRETLYQSLWPDAEWSSSSSSLKVAAHVLRRILISVSSPDTDSSSSLRLVTVENGYSLESRNVWVDFEVFDELISSAKTAEQNGNSDLALRLLRQATDLYDGQFLPGVDLDWAQVQREWLRSGMLYAMEQLAEAEMSAGDHLSVIDRCCRMLEIEPFREETYRMLIGTHGKLGQLAQARRWYRLCSDRLGNELQVKPSVATQRLYLCAMRGELL